VPSGQLSRDDALALGMNTCCPGLNNASAATPSRLATYSQQRAALGNQRFASISHPGSIAEEKADFGRDETAATAGGSQIEGSQLGGDRQQGGGVRGRCAVSAL
jgi:hypothetical protein